MEFLHPNGWKPAKGYANGVVAQGRMVFLGGQIGWNEEQQFESDDFIDQFRQTLHNIVVLLKALLYVVFLFLSFSVLHHYLKFKSFLVLVEHVLNLAEVRDWLYSVGTPIP